MCTVYYLLVINVIYIYKILFTRWLPFFFFPYLYSQLKNEDKDESFVENRKALILLDFNKWLMLFFWVFKEHGSTTYSRPAQHNLGFKVKNLYEAFKLRLIWNIKFKNWWIIGLNIIVEAEILTKRKFLKKFKRNLLWLGYMMMSKVVIKILILYLVFKKDIDRYYLVCRL